MQATLIYNPNSGGAEENGHEAIQEALREAGFQPVYKATSKESDLDSILTDDLSGVVVAAGGDGTMRAVASRLLDKDVPLILLPMGTANNVARTLGIKGTPLEIIAAMADPLKCKYDLGRVSGPWGEDLFLEGAGYGFYADTLAVYDPDKGKSVWRGLESVTRTLNNYEPHEAQIVLDGQDISGRFLMFEAMNTSAIGPRLRLAEDADPGDGLLHVVRVREDRRDGFLSYLGGVITGEMDDLPSVETLTGCQVEITWNGFPVHVDGMVRPDIDWSEESDEPIEAHELAFARVDPQTVTIEILAAALEIWLPKTAVSDET